MVLQKYSKFQTWEKKLRIETKKKTKKIIFMQTNKLIKKNKSSINLNIIVLNEIIITKVSKFVYKNIFW